jgi:hypothetical protein
VRVESIEEWVRNSRLSPQPPNPPTSRDGWAGSPSGWQTRQPEIRRRGNGVIPRVEWSSVARGEAGLATCAEIRRPRAA